MKTDNAEYELTLAPSTTEGQRQERKVRREQGWAVAWTKEAKGDSLTLWRRPTLQRKG